MKRRIRALALLLPVIAFAVTVLVYAGDLPDIPIPTKPSTTQSTKIPGDADNDGAVTLRDAVAIRRSLVGGWNVSVSANADVNGDGKVTLIDVAMIVRYLAGGWNVVLK